MTALPTGPGSPPGSRRRRDNPFTVHRAGRYPPSSGGVRQARLIAPYPNGVPPARDQVRRGHRESESLQLLMAAEARPRRETALAVPKTAIGRVRSPQWSVSGASFQDSPELSACGAIGGLGRECGFFGGGVLPTLCGAVQCSWLVRRMSRARGTSMLSSPDRNLNRHPTYLGRDGGPFLTGPGK